jgi:hypothetical protein
VLHRHPELELELFRLERRHLEQKLTIARHLHDGREQSLGLIGQVACLVAQVVRVIRKGLKARPASGSSALPSGQLLECAE